ncbi:MAG: hypothetical protein WAQ53_13610 [Thiofilum sp.]|uniref:hypothetical protein n=1 Tax=Thiofilum sp. TaxID=2212733 RepID=UPI0025FFFCDC|nr:hypothetical protein [Thiofilum sp.]MBK8453606.1 hypothetical protein [Thiofilum sp.]
MSTETLRLNISDLEALQIKREANSKGALVDIFRYSKDLIEIKIHYPNKVIEVNPKRLY